MMSVPQSLLNILNSWLRDRYQIVKYGNCLSSRVPVVSGVPQGSVVSPLLFTVFINDLLSTCAAVLLIAYADDLKIIGKAGRQLQTAIDAVTNWATENLMEINISKCETLHFGRKNPLLKYTIDHNEIPCTKMIRDLGLNVDSSLGFDGHAMIIKSKCIKLIALLFKCFYSKNQDLYIKFYTLYVLPVIDYASFMYCSTSQRNIKTIESIQHYFTRRLFHRIYRNQTRPEYSERLKLFGMKELHIRYRLLDLILLFKISKGILSTDFCPSLSNRSQNLFIIPPINTSLYRSSFFHRSLTLWNKHSKSLDTSSISKFYNSLQHLTL